MDCGLVFNIQRYSVQDGPGIRTTVFLKGCPLTCWWCHNPESQHARAQIMVMGNRCIRCDECVQVCPAGEQTHDDAVRAAACTRCGQCVEVCPTEARQLAGRSMTVEQVVREILKDRLFYDQSAGGVTFSGGEPLVQFEFLQAALAACRGREIHTAVDTCGYASWEKIEAIAPLTSLFLYDLKVIDDRKHREFTGVSNGGILENLTRLSRIHSNIWIRIPLIPGLNDSADDLDAAAEFVQTLPGVRQINLLPYHATATDKFARLGKAYVLGKLAAPTPEALQQAAERFRQCGLPIRTSG